MTDLEEELYERVSEISEEAFCSGWQGGIEFDLWDRIAGTERRWARSS
ncbi:hypothetical protein [Nannocystis punicea]|uniref:Uncharacterized protein n=1 Tax=Nannocystis punicea TaxID=2995304 RepID=A0ABY7H5S2_9BACT|nr:hypothetical protein [Nannocystis poenicansa]WAS94616.1 hypothetical protein O0S08_00515 [Nannocystis poenicansa]